MNVDRAGRYTNQIGGYRAFVPNSLPPDPPIQLDNEFVQLLTVAEMDKYQRNRRFVYSSYLSLFIGEHELENEHQDL